MNSKILVYEGAVIEIHRELYRMGKEEKLKSGYGHISWMNQCDVDSVQ